MSKVITKKPLVETSEEILEYIDPTKRVRIYRNLHRGCLSVKQDGLVKCHTYNASLKDCTFIVNKGGQDRVRKEKRKNVHSYIDGFIVRSKDYNDLLPFEWQPIYYNPYKTDYWVEIESDKYISNAQWVEASPTSVTAFNLSYKKGSKKCVA